MGGIGSGRLSGTGARALTTDHLRIDSRVWARDGLFAEGGEFTWVWKRKGRSSKAAGVTTGKNRISLDYFLRNELGAPVWVQQNLQFVKFACGFGGHRYFFICPNDNCGRRACMLYLSKRFLCRNCLNLAYPSQCERPLDRAARKVVKTRERLGWGGGALEDPCGRPKGMHHACYRSLLAEHEERFNRMGRLLI